MAGLLFNGTGYVSFPKDNRLILNQTDGWTLLIKMKYGANAGAKKEAVFVGQQDGSLINYVETFVGQATQSDSWNRNRFACHLRTAGGTVETIESPTLTFPDTDYAVYFVRKQSNTLEVGRCSVGGSVQKTTKTNSQPFDIPLQEFFLGYAGNRTTSTHVPLGDGREVKEFGLVSRLMSDADIQSYANGTSFSAIAGADLFGFAQLDEGSGTNVDFDVDLTPVVGTISGGLTWIGASTTPISFSGNIANQTFTVGQSVNVDLSSNWSGTQTPFTFAVTTGLLAGTGLTLSSSGILSGTAALATQTGIVITGTDADTNTAASNSFSVTVNAAPSAITADVAFTMPQMQVAASASVPAANPIFTSEPLRDNTNGNLLANQALDYVAIYDNTTGALVLRVTGLSTNAGGIFTVSDAALTAGVTYKADWKVTSQAEARMPAKAAV